MGDAWAFVGISVALIVAPGPDIALVTRNTVHAGRRAGLVTSLGTSTGLAVHGLGAVLGLSAILATSTTVFTVVKLAGAAYLTYLGVRTLWGLLREQDATPGPALVRERLSPYPQGVLTNVLNPKVAVFFITFLPQFIAPGESAALKTLSLALAFVAMALTWLLVYVSFLHTLSAWFGRPLVRRGIEGVMGCALVLLGIRLGLTQG